MYQFTPASTSKQPASQVEELQDCPLQRAFLLFCTSTPILSRKHSLMGC